MDKIKFLLANLFIWFLLSTILPAGNTLHFKHISTELGLSQNSISCIMQDSSGFMWFGTQEGLNKYDGYTFTVYKNIPGNPNSLSNNQVTVVYEGRRGLIWIGTDGGGMNRFDPVTEEFYRYPFDPNDANSIDNGRIRAICQDRSGALWIGTFSGLSKIVLQVEPEAGKPVDVKERFVHYRYIRNEPRSLSSNVITSIIEDSRGDIWIGTDSYRDGLHKYRPETESFQHFHFIGIRNNRVSTIYEDRRGILWIGTNGGGLTVFDSRTEEYFHFKSAPGEPRGLSSNLITSIYEDFSGILWIGTEDNGLNRFMPSPANNPSRSGKNKRELFPRGFFFHYKQVAKDPHSISSNAVTFIYEDRSRLLWVGTRGGGLNKFDREDKFSHHKSNPDNPDSLGGNFIYALYEDSKGFLWIGTDEHGLDKYDRIYDFYTHYRRDDSDPGSISSNSIRVIFEDRHGGLWIGTNFGGLNRFNRDTGSFTHYLADPNNSGSISNDVVMSIYEDSAGSLWVGTERGGLDRFNRDSETFSHFRRDENDPNSLSDNSVTTIYEAPSDPGMLWIGTLSGGLNRFEPATNKIIRFMENPADPGSLNNNCVQSVCKDRSGVIWVGTYGGGLNKMMRQKGQSISFKHYTEANGLCNNSIYGILEAPGGHLWISTNKGLSRFNPKDESFKNYNVMDGLQGDEFNGGAFHKTKGGEMLFGGINGFNAFFPFKISDNPHIPPVVIIGFKLFNKAVPIGNGSPLKRSIVQTKELQLSYEENAFSFEFAALDFTIPSKNRYSYMMQGFDKDWVQTGSQQRLASYTNLDHGTYLFRVRGSNNDEVWNDEGASIIVVITPPFWKTWWFKLVALLLVLLSIWFMYKGRLRNVRIKTELQTAHDAQMSIMPQKDPEVEGFDISGVCVPAYEVGGDFFDYIWMNGEKSKLGIAIGDVSGKAMKSAMTAVMTSGMIYLETDEHDSVKDIMSHVNRPLYFKTEKRVFTALCLAALNISTKELTFTNAGLNDPLLKSRGKVTQLKSEGIKLPLGVKPDSQYKEKAYRLKTGDVLLLFTDGIPEAKDLMDEFYGADALEKLLTDLDVSGMSAAAIKDRIIAEVKLFTGAAPQHDDITLVVVKVLC
ncbi:MAG: SpoIIE family protein phosphatase [bacterium]|nr:SpoIIE family protein phosphatase [bacterium]